MCDAMEQGSSCVIAATDPRLAGQEVAYLVNGMKSKLLITSEGPVSAAGARGSVYESEGVASKYTVYTALAVTDAKLVLDVQRIEADGTLKDPTPKEYVCVSFTDELFSQMHIEFSNAQKSTVLGITFPNAEEFLGPEAAGLGVPGQSTVKVVITCSRAPDIAVHINRLMTSITASHCSIREDDPRLEGQSVVHLLDNMVCTLKLVSGGVGRRGSVYADEGAASKYNVCASLAVTEKKMLLDIQRLRRDVRAFEYLCLNYEDQLCSEVVLDTQSDEKDTHLVITLPCAARFLGETARELGVPDGADVQVCINTWKAPDIVIHVKAKLKRQKSK